MPNAAPRRRTRARRAACWRDRRRCRLHRLPDRAVARRRADRGGRARSACSSSAPTSSAASPTTTQADRDAVRRRRGRGRAGAGVRRQRPRRADRARATTPPRQSFSTCRARAARRSRWTGTRFSSTPSTGSWRSRGGRRGRRHDARRHRPVRLSPGERRGSSDRVAERLELDPERVVDCIELTRQHVGRDACRARSPSRKPRAACAGRRARAARRLRRRASRGAAASSNGDAVMAEQPRRLRARDRRLARDRRRDRARRWRPTAGPSASTTAPTDAAEAVVAEIEAAGGRGGRARRRRRRP